MSTSGTSSFVADRDLIVRRALRIVGAYQSTDLPRPEQLTDAISILNIMLKTWSREGFLWLRKFTVLPLTAGQNSYLLGPDNADINPPIDRPCHVYSANKRASGGSEVPLAQLSRSDWMAVPNKVNTGTVVQFYYDAQTLNGVLYVWPTPTSTVTDVLVLDHDVQLDIMSDNLNDFDFPPQWLEPITYCLAVRIAPEYGMSMGERAQLEKEAMFLFNQMSSDDRDLGSVRFEVRR